MRPASQISSIVLREIDSPSYEDALGRLLFERMEQLDPSDDGCWNDLTERGREFFRLSAKVVKDRVIAEGLVS